MAEWINDDVETYTGAVLAVLDAIGRKLDPRKVVWCQYPVYWHDRDELGEKVNKDTKKLGKEINYGLNPKKLWQVGIPRFKVVKRGIAHLHCEIDLYYVAYDEWEGWAVSWFGKLIPKADTFDVPLCLLPLLVEGISADKLEVEGTTIVERGHGFTVYDFKGHEWKIPDAFVGFVWALTEKGKGFEGLIDTHSCQLMEKFASELPPADVPKLPSGDDYQAIVLWLKEKMGYPKAKAEEAARLVIEKLSDASLEEKIKQALKYLGG
jgi:hypothetical protein